MNKVVSWTSPVRDFMVQRGPKKVTGGISLPRYAAAFFLGGEGG